MNRALLDRIANTLLYEGYVLYPYRPSVKNRQRWTFGGLYPDAYCRAQRGTEASGNQTQVLFRGEADTTIEATVRFLHLTARQVGELVSPLHRWHAGTEPAFRPVEMLEVAESVFYTWQEAEERQLSTGPLILDEIVDGPKYQLFSFPARRWLEPIAGTDGRIVGVLARQQEAINGLIEARAIPLLDGLFKISVQVLNRTVAPAEITRDEALLHTLVSAHTTITAGQGEFISLLEPPDALREAAALCRNVGVWPVLVGESGEHDTVLASPIILYDYPQVAADSPGDLFDGTEIDEILSLRIMSLTDDEKKQMASVDGRARALLERTERLSREEMMNLHGAMRLPKGGDGQ